MGTLECLSCCDLSFVLDLERTSSIILMLMSSSMYRRRRRNQSVERIRDGVRKERISSGGGVLCGLCLPRNDLFFSSVVFFFLFCFLRMYYMIYLRRSESKIILSDFMPKK